MKTRILGAALLLVCAVAIGYLHLLVHSGSPHEATVRELLTALAVVLAGLTGAMMLVIGHALFEPADWPTRH